MIDYSQYVQKIRAGKIGVVPTDTIYGLVCSAFDRAAVQRVYATKGRTPTKPCIILIASFEDIERFGVELSDVMRTALAQYWPGPVSVIVPRAGDDDLAYLDRGTGTLAFRLPRHDALVNFLREAGPVIAPSANPEGEPPATTIAEAQAYFGDTADFYIDGGVLAGVSSTLIRLGTDGEVTVLREGAARVN